MFYFCAVKLKHTLFTVMKAIIRNLKNIRLAIVAKINYGIINLFSEKSEKRFYKAVALYTAVFIAIQVIRLIIQNINP